MSEPYQLLEKELAEWCGVAPELMVVCSSGTAALHLGLEALQLQPHTRVLVPDFTMISCPRAVSMAGLHPVFVDCDDSLLLHNYYIGSTIGGDRLTDGSPSTRVIMAVHIYGRRCDMDLIDWVAEQYDCYVMEDLAEAHGVKPHPNTDVFCFSFFKNKIIAGEEGGAVVFRDERLAARARQLRSLGFTEEHDFEHVPRGCNYRLSNANARLILDNFELAVTANWNKNYLDARAWNIENPDGKQWEYLYAQRLQNVIWYDEQCPDEWRMPPRDVPWIYDIRIPGMMPLRQTELVRALQAEGIAARHAFKPCHSQEEYRHCPVYGSGNAAAASREVIYLPLTPGHVTRESARRAFEVIRRVVG